MTPVQRYAQAATRIDHARLTGRQPDPADVREALSLEAWATANFDSAQIGALGQLVAQERARYAQQLDGAAVAQADRKAGYTTAMSQALRDATVRATTRHMSHDGKGLTPEQLQQVHATGRYTINAPRARDGLHARAHRVGLTAEQADKQVADARELLDDPKRLDRYLTQRFGDDLVERQRWVDRMQTKILEIGVRERMERRELEQDPDAFKPVERRLSDSDVRRADILNEIGRHGALGLVTDRVSEESLADPGLHGDVARALVAAEITDREGVVDFVAAHSTDFTGDQLAEAIEGGWDD